MTEQDLQRIERICREAKHVHVKLQVTTVLELIKTIRDQWASMEAALRAVQDAKP